MVAVVLLVLRLVGGTACEKWVHKLAMVDLFLNIGGWKGLQTCKFEEE